MAWRKQQSTVHPVFQAAKDGDIDAVEKYLARESSCLHATESDRCSLLHVASTVPLIELLIKRGLKVCTTTEVSRETPLHHAVYRSAFDIAHALISHDADVNAADCAGIHPIHRACDSEHPDSSKLVELLLSRGALQSPDQQNQTPLFWACRRGTLASVKLLLAAGADASIFSFSNETPLHAICQRWDAPEDLRTAIASLLLIHNSELVNLKTTSGVTPLALGVKNGSRIPKLLLKHGASATQGDSLNVTPLHCACRSPSAHPDIIRTLVASGANVNALALFQSEGPLHYAIRFNPALAPVLLELGALLDGPGVSPLAVAAEMNNPELVKLFLSMGVKPTPAALYNVLNEARRRDQVTEAHYAVLHCLLEAGVDTNSTIPAGFTVHGEYPLSLATTVGVRDVCMLLDFGAKVTPDVLQYCCHKRAIGGSTALQNLLQSGAQIPVLALRVIRPHIPIFSDCFPFVDWARASSADLLECFRSWQRGHDIRTCTIWVSTVLLRLPIPWPELPQLPEFLGMSLQSTHDQIRATACAFAIEHLLPQKLC